MNETRQASVHAEPPAFDTPTKADGLAPGKFSATGRLWQAFVLITSAALTALGLTLLLAGVTTPIVPILVLLVGLVAIARLLGAGVVSPAVLLLHDAVPEGKRLAHLPARRPLSIMTALLVASVGVVAVSFPASAATTCAVKNQTSGVTGTDLQDLIATAPRGDTIRVKGTCIGGFRIHRSLHLVGRSTTLLPEPTLDGGGASRVVRIEGKASPHVTITNLTITGGSVRRRGGGIYAGDNTTVKLKGSATVTGNTVNNTANNTIRRYGGGGIYNHRGTVTLQGSSKVTDNATSYGGGGIFNLFGLLRLRGSSKVIGNTATRGGGGIYNHGTFKLRDSSKVNGNTATRGGGIYNYSAGLQLRGSSRVTGNTANRGGGIYNISGQVKLQGVSSVNGNTATRGGGIYNWTQLRLWGASAVTDNTAVRGGGIYNSGTVTLATSSAVTGNTATGSGGGIGNFPGLLHLPGHVNACNSSGADEWVGTISPNTPDDPPTPILITCS